MTKTKPFNIPKFLFVQAYRLVKANGGTAGVDAESLLDFERNLKANLYKLWNRMSSGSYFPPAVKAVSIPKKSGGNRVLGIPTVSDRIAQMVVKLVFEPQVEPHFLPDSYGYRPRKSAIDAIRVTRQRCWQYDWVFEFDIKGLFDNIPHDLMMKAVHKHTSDKWILLYIERWLTAPIQQEDGQQIIRACGTPQGGVISPVLSNLYLHYVFDKWLKIQRPNTLWCRYADDAVVHCKSEAEAKLVQEMLTKRFLSCGLELHPKKSKIVYCSDGKRKDHYPNVSFDFLGFTFRRRLVANKNDGSLFGGFTPAVSKDAQKAMRVKIKSFRLYKRSELSLNEIAIKVNRILQGWINYYGKFHISELNSVWRYLNKRLVSWAMRKYKRFRGRKTKAGQFIKGIYDSQPRLFAHWRLGILGAFV